MSLSVTPAAIAGIGKPVDANAAPAAAVAAPLRTLRRETCLVIVTSPQFGCVHPPGTPGIATIGKCRQQIHRYLLVIPASDTRRLVDQSRRRLHQARHLG